MKDSNGIELVPGCNVRVRDREGQEWVPSIFMEKSPNNTTYPYVACAYEQPTPWRFCEYVSPAYGQIVTTPIYNGTFKYLFYDKDAGVHIVRSEAGVIHTVPHVNNYVPPPLISPLRPLFGEAVVVWDDDDKYVSITTAGVHSDGKMWMTPTGGWGHVCRLRTKHGRVAEFLINRMEVSSWTDIAREREWRLSSDPSFVSWHDEREKGRVA